MKITNLLFTAAAMLSAAPFFAAGAQAQASNLKPGNSLFIKPLENDAALAFSRTADGYSHWLTSTKCPSSINGVPLNQRLQFAVQGHSVKCRYTDSKTMRTSFSIRTFGREEKLAGLVEGIASRIESNEDVLRKNALRNVEFDMAGQKISCATISFDLKPAKSGTALSESITACNMLNWVLQISDRRLTSAKPGRDAIAAAFLKEQGAARQHLSSCITEARRRRELQPSKATGLNIAADRFGYKETGVPCFSGNISGKEGRDPLLLLYWPTNTDTPVTINSVSSNGRVNKLPAFHLQDMWATVPAEKRGEAGYIMVKKDADGTVSSYGGFLKIVSSGRLFGEFEKVRKGELKAQTTSKPNSAGGKNITIG